MKPFHFSLQPLRSLRENKEDALRERYAHALRTVEEAAREVQAASAALNTAYDKVAHELAFGVNSTDLAHAKAWCTRLEASLNRHRAVLEQAQQTAREILQQLTLATRERETLDRFYDKRRRIHAHECRREEQHVLDEMAVQASQLPLPLRPAKPNLGFA